MRPAPGHSRTSTDPIPVWAKASVKALSVVGFHGAGALSWNCGVSYPLQNASVKTATASEVLTRSMGEREQMLRTRAQDYTAAVAYVAVCFILIPAIGVILLR
jgi:hypothetical protein